MDFVSDETATTCWIIILFKIIILQILSTRVDAINILFTIMIITMAVYPLPKTHLKKAKRIKRNAIQLNGCEKMYPMYYVWYSASD